MHETALSRPPAVSAHVIDYVFATAVTLIAFGIAFIADRCLSVANLSLPGEAVRIVVGVAGVVGEQLQIDVIDRGPGIPPDERARIFDMFYSVSRGDRGNKGTGLGLSICRGMIGAHGGTVEALSHEGVGTTIRITLPLPPAPESDA
jgi:two-component system sensor histidine kinase KdpD